MAEAIRQISVKLGPIFTPATRWLRAAGEPVELRSTAADLTAGGSAGRRARIIGAAAAIVPVTIWLAALAQNAVNSPAGDDNFSLLPFINDWTEAHSVGDCVRLITSQFVSHRLIFTKLLTVLDWWTFGQLNFLALQVLGWLGWMTLVGGLVWLTPTLRARPIWTLPLTLLLFHPVGQTNLIAAVGVGNVWVLVFALAAAALALSDTRGSLVLALGFAIASGACFVNGLLVFPALVLTLLVRRRFARAGLFAACGAAVWFAYFQHYHHDAGPFNAIEIVRKAAMMTGGMLKIARTPDAVVLGGGFLILALIGVLVAQARFWREQPVHACFLVFLVASVLTAARGRAGWADAFMLQDRYRIYGLLMLAVVWATLTHWGSRWNRVLLPSACAAAAMLCLLIYANHYPDLRANKARCFAAAADWQLGLCFANTDAPNWPLARDILSRSEALGTFRFSPVLTELEQRAVRGLATVTPTSQEAVLQPNGGAIGFSVCPPAEIADRESDPPDFGVIVVNGRSVVLPPTVFRMRTREIVTRFSVLGHGYGLALPRSEFTPPGRHAVFAVALTPAHDIRVTWSGWVTLP
jgi:hypothetical protein